MSAHKPFVCCNVFAAPQWLDRFEILLCQRILTLVLTRSCSLRMNMLGTIAEVSRVYSVFYENFVSLPLKK